MESGSDVHRFPPSLPCFQLRRSSTGRFVLRRIYLGPYVVCREPALHRSLRLPSQSAADFLTQTGLFSISAIEPEHGFLLFLHNVMGIVDVQTFVYSYTHFASAVGGTRPTPERFLHFFEMHGTEFKFIDTISGENVARAKDRIVARIMRLLELAIQSISSGPVEEGVDEEPISATTKETLEKVYPKKYGQDISPS